MRGGPPPAGEPGVPQDEVKPLPPANTASGLRLLVSARNAEEALQVAAAGIELVDLKDPSTGALGGLDPVDVLDILRRLRAVGYRQPVSATVGDWQPGQSYAMGLERVAAMAETGVDWIKVGVDPRMPRPLAWLALLAAAAAPIVPVLIVDEGLDEALLRDACDRFALLMLDTGDKSGGSLIDRLGAPALRQAVDRAHAAGCQIGLAGALRLPELPALHALRPDLAGFRSAVCAGDRRGALDARLLAALRRAADAGQAVSR